MMTQIWDTAGQERYRSLAKVHYRDANGVILVFDITKRSSFENCVQWIEDLRMQGNQETKLLVLGNKLDLVQMDESTREVQYKEGERLAKTY